MILHIREIKIKWGWSNFTGLWLMEANKKIWQCFLHVALLQASLAVCFCIMVTVFILSNNCVISHHTMPSHHNVLVVLKLILSVACWICLHAASSISIGSLTNWKLKAKYRINMWYPVCPAVYQPRCFLRAKCDLSDQNIAPHVSCVTVSQYGH